MKTSAKVIASATAGAFLLGAAPGGHFAVSARSGDSVYQAPVTPPSILAMGQSAKGDEVTITYAYLPKDGYVAIHPSDSNGKMSEKTIGTLALKAGDYRNFSVKLNEPLKPGEKLWATLNQGSASADTGTRSREGGDPW